MVDKAAFAKRIRGLQWAILLINIVIIAIGGANFGLAVATRPILRLTNPMHFNHMQSICDLIVATGIIQIIVAGYDIFAANWKLTRPLYLAIVLACIAVILEIVTITTCSYVFSESDMIVNESIFFEWFTWDCLPSGSCTKGITFYTTFFMMPQVGLSALAVVFHSLAVLYLFKLLRTLKEKQSQIRKAKMLLGDSKTSITGPLELEKSKKGNETEPLNPFEEFEEAESEPNTPASILQGEHGYVNAGPSLDKDYDDAGVVRNRGKQQSLSFSTNVEIHLFNQQDDEEADNAKTTQM